MDHNSINFIASSWSPRMEHHAMNNTQDHSGHPNMSIDLRVQPGFPYYRYREDPFGWNDIKVLKMMPYSSTMDFSAYDHRPDFTPMMTSTMGMSIGNSSSLTHSWLVPTKDLCNDNYKQQNAVMQNLNPGILELRKEKSRDAARSRRGKENYEFYELAKMLPLPSAITSQLDKASIIRLTISFLKLRDFTGHGDPKWNRDNKSNSKIIKSEYTLDLFEQHEGTHILQSLDGFALSVAADGRFLYISETVSIYLGLSQVEMTGSSIFDYIHHGDHAEVAEQLGLTLSSHTGMTSPSSSDESTGTMNPDVSSQMSLTTSNYKGLERAFCIRMKSTLTKRGCHFKSSGYRVVLLICHLRPQHSLNSDKKSQSPVLGMVALAIALPPPSVHEIRLECDMFVTRINLDFRISHCEPKVKELLDYTPEELTGESLYSLCHGDDASKLRKCHMDLINKGQVLTHYYRMMNKNGGYTWIQTCATVVCSAKNPDEQNIICVNYVVSGKEDCNLIMDHCQLGNIKKEPSSVKNNPESKTFEQKKSLNQTINHNESNSLLNIDENRSDDSYLSTIDSDQKNVINENLNGDEHASSSITMNKRGRKRKGKSETKVESVPQISTPTSFNNTEHNNDYIEHKISRQTSKPIIEHNIVKPDFSANSLLSRQHHDSSFQEQSLTPMPATALLRKLYANRESVIRATIRPTMFPESMHQSSLPTPPNDSYDSQFMHPRIYNGYSSMEYNNSMTPPSSVSPKDLTNHKSNGNYEYTNLSMSAQSGARDHEIMPQMPLKHQPYAIHEMEPSYNIEHQSQYFQYHSGFHLYHKGVYPPH
ncbi:unnamed protein product [Diamesa serratosioi]